MIDKLLFRILMWIWIRRATRLYGGPGNYGELFNTACFQNAVAETTRHHEGELAIREWLQHYGMMSGSGGYHWFNSYSKAQSSYESPYQDPL